MIGEGLIYLRGGLVLMMEYFGGKTDGACYTVDIYYVSRTLALASLAS
jgi:hypothetical protein